MRFPDIVSVVLSNTIVGIDVLAASAEAGRDISHSLAIFLKTILHKITSVLRVL